jgi:hypothetical protein
VLPRLAQFAPLIILETCDRHISYVAQMSDFDTPRENSPFTALASSSDSLAFPWISPLLLRPFASISAILSSCVPKNKWWTLTHLRLSHECNTHMFLGMAPYISFQATRCALAFVLLAFTLP